MARPTTLQDVADHLGLSVSTVWKALADDRHVAESTKLRVREGARRLNYRCRSYGRSAQRPGGASGPRRLALVSVQEPPTVEHLTVLSQVCQELETRVTLELTSLAADDSSSHQLERLTQAAAGTDGMILSGRVPIKLMRHAATLSLPVVVIGNVIADPDEPIEVGHRVGFDCEAMGRLATRVLWRAGHRRIAFMAAGTALNLWNDRWLAGYRAALAELAGCVDPVLAQIPGRSDVAELLAAQAWAQLHDPPTAFVLPDPSLAIHMISALCEVGLKPAHDALVIGGTQRTAGYYGVLQRPLILVDVQALVQACLRLLRALASDTGPPPGRYLLPFVCRNFPAAVSVDADTSRRARSGGASR